MIEINLELAESISKAALAKASEIGRPMSVSIVDESGRLVYFNRADGAGFLTFDTSKAKAVAAASFKRTTLEITKNKDINPLLWYSLSSIVPALPSPGGVPIIKNGRVIGAIGLGGGSPEEDHECAMAGIAIINSNN